MVSDVDRLAAAEFPTRSLKLTLVAVPDTPNVSL